jgi:CTP synthase
MTNQELKKGKPCSFIFITGGVISSLGKGITAAAIGTLLKERGFSVTLRKIDPYLNIDPGTMGPGEHGEVFVTEDGTETDLDLGNYERFTQNYASTLDYTTTGKIYLSVLHRERQGKYLGKTVQVIPHITNAIKEFIQAETQDKDFLICEIGGTVGDIESLPFLEAIRQMRHELGFGRVAFVHVGLVPFIPTAGECKTKPFQHSVRELQRSGIQPDILVCRSPGSLPEGIRHKLSLFCNVPKERVLEAPDVGNINKVPRVYHEAGLDTQLCSFFNREAPQPNLQAWDDLIERLENPNHELRLIIVGKYTALSDAYKSLNEAIVHAGGAKSTHIDFTYIAPELFETEAWKENLKNKLLNVQGVIVPGGFGERGTLGKLRVIEYARTQKIPFFGICLGMQLALLEFARNVLKLKDANSTEFQKTKHPIIHQLTEWQEGDQWKLYQGVDKGLGGTMRLGSYPCNLKPQSLIAHIYDAEKIYERHRHRYEVNMDYRKNFEESGLIFSGLSPDELLGEVVELKGHPWFVGVQFHPELKSHPLKPHPLFLHFVDAMLKQSYLI